VAVAKKDENRVIKPRKTPTALMKIIKALDKASFTAVARLEKLCDSSDEKIGLDASKAVLSLRDDMENNAKKIELQRMIVEQKLGKGIQTEDEDDTPTVDFEQIQEIS